MSPKVDFVFVGLLKITIGHIGWGFFLIIIFSPELEILVQVSN